MCGRTRAQVNEVWNFVEDGVTREVHLIARVDVRAGAAREFSPNYLTKSWRRVPMFSRISINGSVKWLLIPDFHRTDGPTWTDNLLAPCTIWGDGGSTTNPNRGSQSGGYSGSVSVPWNCLVRVLLVYRRRISENKRAAARRVHDNLLRGNCMACIKSPSTCHKPIKNWRINWRYDEWDDPVDQ